MNVGAIVADLGSAATLAAFVLVIATPVMLSFVIRRNPAVAALPRRQAMVTWAGVLFLVGVVIVAVGSGSAQDEVWSVVGLFSAAFGITLISVELILTGLAPTADDDEEEAPSPE